MSNAAKSFRNQFEHPISYFDSPIQFSNLLYHFNLIKFLDIIIRNRSFHDIELCRVYLAVMSHTACEERLLNIVTLEKESG